METYDLVIIGGGAGAFAAAMKANELDARAALINDGLPLGGTCVNVGCVPSKTLLRAAEIIWEAQHHPFAGIELALKRFDFGEVIHNELQLVEELRKEKYEDVLAGLPRVTHIPGRAKFLDPHTIAVNGRRLSSQAFVIATGSTATVPSIEGLTDAGYITHIEALRSPEQPQRLVVIGAGPVGLELGQLFHRFGTHVTILQRAATILPRTEPEIAYALYEALTAEGIEIHTNAQVTNVRRVGPTKLVAAAIGNEKKEFPADEILLAAGKTPNTQDLDLRAAGVEVTDHGTIKTDEWYATRTPHIFAVGDVIDKPRRLETTAGREGMLAAKNALTGSQERINYDEVPYTVFTDPQVAGVGRTDAEAVRQGVPCNCHTIPFALLPKARVLRDVRGAIKMVTDDQTKRIVGIHMLSPHAGDIIMEGALAIRERWTIYDLIETVHVFPTLAESLKLAAQSFVRDVTKAACCIE